MTTEIITQGLREITDPIRDEQGQGLVEYALILLFVSVVAIVVISILGPNIAQYINSIANSL